MKSLIYTLNLMYITFFLTNFRILSSETSTIIKKKLSSYCGWKMKSIQIQTFFFLIIFFFMRVHMLKQVITKLIFKIKWPCDNSHDYGLSWLLTPDSSASCRTQTRIFTILPPFFFPYLINGYYYILYLN